MELNDTQQLTYYQNLLDAGCDKAESLRCIAMLQDNLIAELLNKLELHRRKKLDELHINQKQLDCLDYLVYKIRQNLKLEK